MPSSVAHTRELRVVALLATYNERRFIDGCLRHLHANGVETYLIDNRSTDDTVAIAERHLGSGGLIGIEEFPRHGTYPWRALLARKEELATELDADWFIHLDADELRLPPAPHHTLAKALAEVGRQGYNAVDFFEFTFIPTREEPDHDHPEFQRTLRTYYPFAPRERYQVKAWKADGRVELAWNGGHEARFPGRAVYPKPFPMKHYLFLSVPHAIEKYVEREFDPAELESGWHGWRACIDADDLRLPSRSELVVATGDGDLDPSEPRTRHHLDELVRSRRTGGSHDRRPVPGESDC